MQTISYRVVMDNELYHHGIKGQKWYVRRYQNEDGTLTEEGKKRYAKQIRDSELKEYYKRLKEQNENSYKMSDDELRKKINRLRMEEDLDTLTKRRIEYGKYSTKSTLRRVGETVMSTVATGAVMYIGQAILTGHFDKNKFAKSVFKVKG